MNNNDGQVLTTKVAQELIEELFRGQTVQLQQIREKVDAVHVERGGQLPNVKWHHPVTYALSRMKRMGRADNPERGHWSILIDEESQLEISTLNRFMQWVQELPDGNYVYRGVSNHEYPIEASTYRRLQDEKGEIRDEDKTVGRLLQINREMIEDANRHKHGWENDQPPRDLDLLAKLQHSGAATCLIDFTKNPLVALWMACRKSSSGIVDGKVYAVKIGLGTPFKEVNSNDVDRMEIKEFFQANDKIGYQLYQWQPDYQDNRMLAQQSIFLFGGGWGAVKESEFCVILGQDKQDIWDSLKKSAGISEDILFPDFEGFASQRAHNKSYNQPEVPIDIDPESTPSENGIDETIDEESQREVSAISDLQLSLEAFREGNNENGVQYYNNSMKFDPSDELLNGYYRERAAIYYEKAYFQSAILDCDKAIHFNSDDVVSHELRGQANFGLDRYTEAIVDFDKVISINSENVSAFYWRGMAKYDLKQFGEAILDFDEAISLNPTDESFYHWRGLASYQSDFYEEAVDFFDKAISLNSSHTYSFYWRGRAKYNLHQYAEAISDFDKAISLNPTDARSNGHTYYSRGLAKKQIGVFDAARADLNIALMCAEEAGNYDLHAIIRQELLLP